LFTLTKPIKTANMAREKLEPLDFVKDLRIFLGKLEDRD